MLNEMILLMIYLLALGARGACTFSIKTISSFIRTILMIKLVRNKTIIHLLMAWKHIR